MTSNGISIPKGGDAVYVAVVNARTGYVLWTNMAEVHGNIQIIDIKMTTTGLLNLLPDLQI